MLEKEHGHLGMGLGLGLGLGWEPVPEKEFWGIDLQLVGPLPLLTDGLVEGHRLPMPMDLCSMSAPDVMLTCQWLTGVLPSLGSCGVHMSRHNENCAGRGWARVRVMMLPWRPMNPSRAYHSLRRRAERGVGGRSELRDQRGEEKTLLPHLRLVRGT